MRLRSVLLASAAAVAVTLGSGCGYVAPVVPPMGLIYSDISAPLDTNMVSTPTSSREGSATSSSILGLIAMGDCSVNSAARAGGLTRVDYADYSYTNILFIYQTFTVTVYGE
jgi:hypothetical protein